MRADLGQKAHLFELAAPKYSAAADRWPDSQLAVDGLFMAAESYFFADNYDQANLAYEKLVKDFPHNRYLDLVDQRRFLIARHWLDLNRANPESFYYVNWFNKERPWRDARGHGLRIFDKICVDDPTGRLSDDATLASANEHFAAGDFLKADEKYTDLRQAYPSSEHQFLAHFLGLKAKLNCYQGPAYGGTLLDEAEKLVKQIRRQFPLEAEKERIYLDRAAAEIRFHKAERLNYLAQYYDNRSEYRAAQHYYAQVVRDFNDTPHAQRAEERIAQIAPLPPIPAQQLPWLVNLLPESDKVKPIIAASEKIRQQEAEEAAQLASQPQYSDIQPASVQR
jgi:outer membrane protein assembly factor BamD (BamD/ComL family)